MADTQAKVLMVQGASSSVGKSLLVTALCRLYARRGWRVAPFKAQNMSNNASVCPGGGEIGRAQAVQAQAAGIQPTVEMNPILLKPEADQRSQVVVRGQVWRTLPGREYYRHKQALWTEVTTSLDSLRTDYDLVLLEGAGSPAELNLKRGDIVNMAVARYARSPVLLVGDIDRGGVFAQLLGTLCLLPPEERALVKGLLVNKFRGDPTLFTDGITILAQRSGRPVLGVVPYLPDHGVPQEDAVVLDEPMSPTGHATADEIDIAVIRLPRIANFDDFDPLTLEPGVRVRYVDRPSALGQPHAIILPGTKSTMADLAWLHECGLSAAIAARARQGVMVTGICGGYQMLGEAIYDPQQVESDQTHLAGLALLPVTTTFAATKALYRSRARITGQAGFLASLTGVQVEGYEIHMGETHPSAIINLPAGCELAGRAEAQPAYTIIERDGRPVEVVDGMIAPDGQVFGVYLHGIFDNDPFRRAWLHHLRASFQQTTNFYQARERAFDRLTDGVAAALDLDQLDAIIHAGG